MPPRRHYEYYFHEPFITERHIIYAMPLRRRFHIIIFHMPLRSLLFSPHFRYYADAIIATCCRCRVAIFHIIAAADSRHFSAATIVIAAAFDADDITCHALFTLFAIFIIADTPHYC